MEYWIAEISFFEGNPKSKYIVQKNGNYITPLTSEPVRCNIKDFHYIKLKKQIKL